MVAHARRVRDEGDARELLARWRESGESMAEWCRANGVVRQSLQWWRGRRTDVGDQGVVRVAEVVLPAGGPEYRIVLGNGREVVVGEFEPEALRRLLEVVDT
jgi:hypothetical protein